MTSKEELEDLKARADEVSEWASAGKNAFELAQDVAIADKMGKKINMDEDSFATTISGAVRLFFDGKIVDPEIREKIKRTKLDMKHLRTSLVEQTLARAIPDIINSGNIERLAKLGMLGGEAINPAASGNSVVVKYVSEQDEQEVEEHIKSVIESND